MRCGKNAVENLINRFLLEKEAAAKGVTVEELRKLLVSEKTEISDADVERAYSENGIAVAAAHGAHTVEETKKIIRQQLEDRAKSERYKTVLAELRKQAKVDIFLEEPPPPVTVSEFSDFQCPTCKQESATIAPQPPLAPVSDAGPSRGSQNSPVTVSEFSDFQCPTCKRESATIAKLLQLYDGKVRLVFKQTPLPIHPQAWLAAQASVCAAEQGKFWEYHDKLFSGTDLSYQALTGYAKELGLRSEDFDKCLDSDAARAAVEKDVQEARLAGVRVTPTFVINGRPLVGFIDLETFKKGIDRQLSNFGPGASAR